jgi:hypothetical protein
MYTRALLRCGAKFFAADVTVCRLGSNYCGLAQTIEIAMLQPAFASLRRSTALAQRILWRCNLLYPQIEPPAVTSNRAPKGEMHF